MSIFRYDLTHTLVYEMSDAAQARLAWDEIHAVTTLQGLVNRDAPRLYLRYIEHLGRNVDDYWLDHLRQPGNWLDGVSVEEIDSLERLVETFREDLAGAVVYDSAIYAASNVASSLAGVENLLAVRIDESPNSIYSRLITGGPQLPVVRKLDAEAFAVGEQSSGSTKCDAYLWAKRELIDTGRCDPKYMGYYLDAYWIDHATNCDPDQHTVCNHDYFVAKRAFFADLNCWSDEKPIDDPDQPLGADAETLQNILRALYEKSGGEVLHVGGFTPWEFKYAANPGVGGTHHGVQSEWELVRMVSAYNGFIDADALGYASMANASFFMHYPLERHYAQAKSVNKVQPAAGSDKDYVMFYVGDFDAAAWLYRSIPDLWADPRRGEVPLSWAISPILCRRAPMVMAHMWKTRSPNDCFMAADNGAGYLNPSMLIEPRPVSGLPSGLDTWTEHCRKYYEQWDLSITGFIIDGRAAPSDERVFEAYSKFSPDGVVAQYLDKPVMMCGSMPVSQRGPDIGDDPETAANRMAESIKSNRRQGVRFHWFRSILQSPSWHADVVKLLCQQDSKVEAVLATDFFELLRNERKASG